MSILVDENTTFIIQGITGREAVTMAREVLDYGSKLVGGVTPGRKGRNVHGVPVEDTVRAFTERERVDASVVAVPPAFAADAVFEAIEAGVKLVIIVTERIPRKQVAQFVEYADQHGRAHHRPELPRRDPPGQVARGRHRRCGGVDAARVRARLDRRDVALGRHDRRDRERAQPRPASASRPRSRSVATPSSARPTPS